jgi:hypothetical protein
MPNEIFVEKRYKKSLDILFKRKKKLDDDQKSRYVVHEILNPLSVINNCTDIMINKLNSTTKYYDSGYGSCSDSDSNSSNSSGNNISESDKKQIMILLSMIKNQINKCSEVSKSLMTQNFDNVPINVNNMLTEYINSFKSCNPSVNIILMSNINNTYHFRSNNSKAYLKIIFDNMIHNVLKYNNSAYIKVSKLIDNKIEIIINDNDIKKNDERPINEKKESNFIGLEIIEKLCSILNIQWQLIQNEKGKYFYKLIFDL